MLTARGSCALLQLTYSNTKDSAAEDALNRGLEESERKLDAHPVQPQHLERGEGVGGRGRERKRGRWCRKADEDEREISISSLHLHLDLTVPFCLSYSDYLQGTLGLPLLLPA